MFGGNELGEELGLNWYDVSARNYDASIGRWMNIDPLANLFADTTPYNYAQNLPTLLNDETGLFSTVVDENGVVTDHVDDDDDQIYLNSRGAENVVGIEEDGKEYNVGDKIFETDDIVDTYFELSVVAEQNIREAKEITVRVNKAEKIFNRIILGIQSGRPITEKEKRELESAAYEFKHASLRLKYKQEELQAIIYLFSEYNNQIPMNELGKAVYNSLVNLLFSQAKVDDFVKNTEIPDGSGETMNNKTLDTFKDKFKMEPSDGSKRGIRYFGQELPMTLDRAWTITQRGKED